MSESGYTLRRNRARPSKPTKPSAITKTTINSRDISGTSVGYGTVTGSLRAGSVQPSVT